MIHLHFGCGRLGLGLVVPFLSTNESKRYLFNRVAGGSSAADADTISSADRNRLLASRSGYAIVRRKPGDDIIKLVNFTKFVAYTEASLAKQVEEILGEIRDDDVIVVTVSIVRLEHYKPIFSALGRIVHWLERRRDKRNIFFIACENEFDSLFALNYALSQNLLSTVVVGRLIAVRAIVDRICMSIGSYPEKSKAGILRVQAEKFGSFKLEAGSSVVELMDACRGGETEFVTDFELRKNVKLWLVNGVHVLAALRAFHDVEITSALHLNNYINFSNDTRQGVVELMDEFVEGSIGYVKAAYSGVDLIDGESVETHLTKFGENVLQRISEEPDPLPRILTRFRSPSPHEYMNVQNFFYRLVPRVETPLNYYERVTGRAPRRSFNALMALANLIAGNRFIDIDAKRER